jgi:hypothetical protein
MIGALIGLAARSAVAGAGFGAGYNATQRVMDNRVTPMWQGTVGDTALVLMSVHTHGRQSYALHVVYGGVSHPAGAFWTYPEALAAVTGWQQYLTNGGTVMAWLQNNAANAALEAEVLS